MTKKMLFSSTSLPSFIGYPNLWLKLLLCSSRSERIEAQLLLVRKKGKRLESGHIFALPNIFPVTASMNSWRRKMTKVFQFHGHFDMLNGAKRVSGKLAEFKSPRNMEIAVKIVLLNISN